MVATVLCRKIRWITESSTPKRFGFDANPRPNTCQPCISAEVVAPIQSRTCVSADTFDSVGAARNWVAGGVGDNLQEKNSLDSNVTLGERAISGRVHRPSGLRRKGPLAGAFCAPICAPASFISFLSMSCGVRRFAEPPVTSLIQTNSVPIHQVGT